MYEIYKSRSKATGGTELGLAIAQSIVNEHRGTIRIEDVEKGLAYRIKFAAN